MGMLASAGPLPEREKQRCLKPGIFRSIGRGVPRSYRASGPRYLWCQVTTNTYQLEITPWKTWNTNSNYFAIAIGMPEVQQKPSRCCLTGAIHQNTSRGWARPDEGRHMKHMRILDELRNL